MARALVILPTGGYRAGDFVRAAASMDVDLAIASERPDLLADPSRFVLIDCTRPQWSADAIADLASTTPIDAIVAADDTGVEIAALAAEQLGLPNHSPLAATLTRDKAAMRRQLAASEVPQPAYRVTTVEDAADAAAELGYPVVVKPRSLTASQGVLRVDRPGDLAAAVTRVDRIRVDAGEPAISPFLIERFVGGPEFTVEGLTWNGELEVLAIMEKPDPLNGPAFQETMFVTPPRLDAASQDSIVDAVRRAVRALDFGDGPVHAEVRLAKSGPVVLELAARTIGGLCSRALRFGLMGTSLEALALRNALGLRKRLPPGPGAGGALMVPIPKPGQLIAVNGVSEASAIEHITEIEITAGIGTEIAPPPEGDRYLGFVIAHAPNTEEVISALRAAETLIDVEIT